MRDISIKKLNDRHYVVYINGECVHEGIDRGSCLKYLRAEKRKFLRETSKKSVHEVSGAWISCFENDSERVKAF